MMGFAGCAIAGLKMRPMGGQGCKALEIILKGLLYKNAQIRYPGTCITYKKLYIPLEAFSYFKFS